MKTPGGARDSGALCGGPPQRTEVRVSSFAPVLRGRSAASRPTFRLRNFAQSDVAPKLPAEDSAHAAQDHRLVVEEVMHVFRRGKELGEAGARVGELHVERKSRAFDFAMQLSRAHGLCERVFAEEPDAQIAAPREVVTRETEGARGRRAAGETGVFETQKTFVSDFRGESGVTVETEPFVFVAMAHVRDVEPRRAAVDAARHV